MLQQAGYLVAEAAFHQLRMLQLLEVGIVVAGEVHHPAALLQQSWQRRTHHAVQTDGPLTAAHHHHQRACAGWDPAGQGLRRQKAGPHRCARQHRLAAGDARCGGGKPTATALQKRPSNRVTRPGMALDSCSTTGMPHQRAARIAGAAM